MRFIPSRGVFARIAESGEVTAALTEVAEEIADTAVQISPMARSEPGRYGPMRVTSSPGRATAAATGSFAHIDEWGGRNSPAHASMRRAAARFGRFKES